MVFPFFPHFILFFPSLPNFDEKLHFGQGVWREQPLAGLRSRVKIIDCILVTCNFPLLRQKYIIDLRKCPRMHPGHLEITGNNWKIEMWSILLKKCNTVNFWVQNSMLISIFGKNHFLTPKYDFRFQILDFRFFFFRKSENIGKYRKTDLQVINKVKYVLFRFCTIFNH